MYSGIKKSLITLSALAVLAAPFAVRAAEDAPEQKAPVETKQEQPAEAAKPEGSAKPADAAKKEDAAGDTVLSANKGAKQFVVEISDKVFSLMNSTTLSDEQKEKQLEDIFNKYVDTNYMGSFAMGPYMRQLSPEQKTRYLKLYHDYMVKNYVPKFRDYTGRKYEILRTEEKGNGEVQVQVKLKSTESGEPDVNTHYRLHKADGTYKVIDFSGEGVSMITTQRSDFGGMISRKGVDYFLDRLEAKVKSQES